MMRHTFRFYRCLVVFFLAFWMADVALAQPKSAPKKAAPAKVAPAKAAPPKVAPGKAATPKVAPADRPELALQLGHSLVVRSIAYSPDGSMLASAAGDATVKLWDARTRELIRTIPAHTASVSVVVWSPDGNTLASGSEDGSVKFWNAANGRLLRTIAARPAVYNAAVHSRVYALAYSPDGNTLAVGYGDANTPNKSQGMPLYKGELVLFDAGNGTVKQRPARNTSIVRGVAFSPDGRTLVSSGMDGMLRVWDAQTGAQLRNIAGQTIYALAFSPDGKMLAAANPDKTVHIWRVSDWTLSSTLTGHTYSVFAVAFSPDGKLVASSAGDNQLLIWDSRSGERIRTIPLKYTGYAVAFSPDGTTLVNGRGTEVKAFDVQSGAPAGNFEAHPRAIRSLGYSPDGKTLAVISGKNEPICLWDTQTGRLLKTLEDAHAQLESLAFSPNGNWIAAASSTNTNGPGGENGNYEILLWNARTGALVRRMEGHKESVFAVAFSPDSKLLASASIVRVFRPHSDRGEIKFWNPQNGQLLRTIQNQLGAINSLDFSRDGKLLASGNFNAKDKGFVEIWNSRTGQLLRTLSGGRGWVQSVHFARDNSTLAVGGRDGLVRTWNAHTGKFLKSFAHNAWIRSVAFSPDGSKLASGGRDKLIRVWDAKSGKLLHVLRGHEYSVETLDFSPDGNTLASGSWDTTVRLWNVREGRQLAALLTAPPQTSEDGESSSGGAGGVNGEPLWLTTTPEGYYDCAEGADYLIKWRFNRKLLPFYHFEETYRRPDLLQRALRGERIAARPLLITRVPPAIRLLALANIPNQPGKLRVLIQAADDSELQNSHFQLYVNGVLIPDQVAKPIIVDGKPIIVDGKPIVVGGKPIVVGGKPIVVGGKPIIVDGKPIIVDGKPIVVDGKPIVVDGKPITADGRAVPGVQKVSAQNGSLPSVTASGPTATGEDAMASYAFHRLYVMDVALPREERIVLRAVVTDNEGNKSDDGVTMQRHQIEPKKGNLYVLAIGVSSYRNPLYNISYAAADARSLAATMDAQAGRHYAKVQTVVLNDAKANVRNIRAALNQLKAAGPDDTVMLFLSGHGVAAGGKTYFAPWGIFVRDLPGTCLEWSEIVGSLSGLYAKKLLFTDACHSGAKLGNWQANSSQLAETVRRESGIVMFASSQGDEFSFEDKESRQGTFSRALVEGFAGKADIDGDGNITLPELTMYVPKRVSEKTNGLQNPQLVLVQDFNPQTILAKANPNSR